MNFQIGGQKIKTKKQTKHLGIIIDDYLSFKTHIEWVRQKIARATSLLAKLRNYVPLRILKWVYFVLFDSQKRYVWQI